MSIGLLSNSKYINLTNMDDTKNYDTLDNLLSNASSNYQPGELVTVQETQEPYIFYPIETISSIPDDSTSYVMDDGLGAFVLNSDNRGIVLDSTNQITSYNFSLVDKTLESGNVLIGNTSNTAVAVPIGSSSSGDITGSYDSANNVVKLIIGDSKVTNAMLVDQPVSYLYKEATYTATTSGNNQVVTDSSLLSTDRVEIAGVISGSTVLSVFVTSCIVSGSGGSFTVTYSGTPSGAATVTYLIYRLATSTEELLARKKAVTKKTIL